MLTKVISGGQTGVDQMGIKIAKTLGFETGGHAPKGWKTENGPLPRLADYGLIESHSTNYNHRTELNVMNADATVMFGDLKSAGSRATLGFIATHRKPNACNPNADELINFVKTNNIQILNVAGNRGSKLTKTMRSMIGSAILIAFTELKKNTPVTP